VIAAVIFDCDGTLVDSEPLARRAWDACLATHGYAIREDEYEGLVGLPYARVHAFFAERVPGLEDPAAFWGRYSAALFELIDSSLEPFADAVATVHGVRAAGIAVAVASSSPRERLDRTLARAGLAGEFAVSVAGDEIEHGKPAPDMFLAVAERLGVAAERCAVVEDTPTGVAAGRAAGMRTIAIARGNGDAARLAEADAVLTLLSPEAVLAG
jgi:HAD superfamily hydrolase (TIGR01509 family)